MPDLGWQLGTLDRTPIRGLRIRLNRSRVRAFERGEIIGTAGSHLGSHSAKSRKESGEVQAATCPVQRRLLTDSNTRGQRSGLIHTEEAMRIAGNVRPSWSLCGAGPARAEIHSHLPGQGYYVATLLIRNGDLVVGQHCGQVL